jgi:hypothetical protein
LTDFHLLSCAASLSPGLTHHLSKMGFDTCERIRDRRFARGGCKALSSMAASRRQVSHASWTPRPPRAPARSRHGRPMRNSGSSGRHPSRVSSIISLQRRLADQNVSHPCDKVVEEPPASKSALAASPWTAASRRNPILDQNHLARGTHRLGGVPIPKGFPAWH